MSLSRIFSGISILAVSLVLVAPALAEESQATASDEAVEAPVASRVQADQLLLDQTSVRGNQELPRVLYIVPWKDSELGDVVGKPVNSLIDEVLNPVDRDVFLRQTKYFNQLYGSEESAE